MHTYGTAYYWTCGMLDMDPANTKKGSIARAQEGMNSKGNIMPYIGPHLIPIGYHIQYQLILTALFYGLVTPTTVYG